MMNNKTVVNSVLTILVVVAAYLLIVRPNVTMFWDFQYKNYLNQAVDGCIKSSALTFSEAGTGATQTMPIEDWYTRCMKDKGY